MYQELLEALAEGRAYTLGSLSHHTGLSESLVEQLLDELEQRGFIAQLVNKCAGGCAGCGLMGTCDALRPIAGWQFTDKGLKALHGEIAIG
ncbi:helix-turn-helix domain-containing protein [Candidatus Bipolaricaulota bacterium]|nr:helix-turn-helix domain-containing protein [Candidatus Bipolaricaulota bacterium]